MFRNPLLFSLNYKNRYLYAVYLFNKKVIYLFKKQLRKTVNKCKIGCVCLVLKIGFDIKPFENLRQQAFRWH